MVSPLSRKSRRLATAAALVAVAVSLSLSQHQVAAEELATPSADWCEKQATEDEIAQGLQIGTDTRCGTTEAAGCIDASCRYCTTGTTEEPVADKYADYITCDDLLESYPPPGEDVQPQVGRADSAPPIEDPVAPAEDPVSPQDPPGGSNPDPNPGPTDPSSPVEDPVSPQDPPGGSDTDPNPGPTDPSSPVEDPVSPQDPPGGSDTDPNPGPTDPSPVEDPVSPQDPPGGSDTDPNPGPTDPSSPVEDPVSPQDPPGGSDTDPNPGPTDPSSPVEDPVSPQDPPGGSDTDPNPGPTDPSSPVEDPVSPQDPPGGSDTDPNPGPTDPSSPVEDPVSPQDPPGGSDTDPNPGPTDPSPVEDPVSPQDPPGGSDTDPNPGPTDPSSPVEDPVSPQDPPGGSDTDPNPGPTDPSSPVEDPVSPQDPPGGSDTDPNPGPTDPSSPVEDPVSPQDPPGGSDTDPNPGPTDPSPVEDPVSPQDPPGGSDTDPNPGLTDPSSPVEDPVPGPVGQPVPIPLPAPSPTDSEPIDTGCPFPVLKGDYDVGLQLVGDPWCATDGIGGGLTSGAGCYEKVCRFCTYTDAAADRFIDFYSCENLGYYFDANSAPVENPAPTPGPVVYPVPAPGQVDSPVPAPAPVPASGSDGPPPPIPPPATNPTTDTGCPYPVSDGDFRAGLQLVGDPSCANPGSENFFEGLGCFEKVCRFCSFAAAGTKYVPCEKLGYHFNAPGPITAPAPGTGYVPPSVPSPSPPSILAPNSGTNCPFSVTTLQSSVGIQLVGDPECSNGGQDCVGEICRFCRLRNTPLSMNYIECAKLGWYGDYSATPAPGSVPATTPVPVPVPAPAPGTVITSAPTPAHGPTPAPATNPKGSACPFPVSDGDRAVGILLVSDPACVQGGQGCFKDVCRFCKVRDTPQSAGFDACSDLGYTSGTVSTPAPVQTSVPAPGPGTVITSAPTPAHGPTPAPATNPKGSACPFPVSDGDRAVGILLVSDPACVQGGRGCFMNVCRFCQIWDTPQSRGWDTCASLGYNAGGAGTTSAPLPNPNPNPSPSSGSATTPAPSSNSPSTSNTATSCPFATLPGDVDVGVLLVGDPSCAVGGLGCYENVCRFCKVRDTPQSKHWVTCASLGYPKTPVTNAPIATTTKAPVATTTKAPVATPAPVTSTTKTPVVPVKTLRPATPVPPIANPTDIDDANTNCPYAVSDGDFAAGIQLVGDAKCAAGGRGCFQKVCRFCKFRNTEQSKHMMTCAEIGYPQFGTPVQDPSTPNVSGCPYDVSAGDAAVGINLIGDPSCAKSGGMGCFENVCRYCKEKDTPQSMHLLKCVDVKAAQIHTSKAVKLASVSASSTENQLDALFKDNTFKWSITGAACVGVVAAVALVALGAKRAVTRRGRKLKVDEAAVDDNEAATTSEKPKTARSLLTVVSTDATEEGSV